MKLVRSNLPIILILVLAAATRLLLLHHFPAGLNADEAAIGYNAYSMLNTARDEHGALLPLSFRSFDDYKPPLYFYLVLPFVALMGLSVWAVRLPSAFLGIANVYLLYLLVDHLFPRARLKLKSITITAGHFAALVLSILPWHIHFSRGGWEVNVATFIFTLGVYLLLRSLTQIKLLLPAAISFALSLYTYHSLRIILPLFLLGFLVIYFQDIKKLLKKRATQKYLALSLAVPFVLLLPLLLQIVNGSLSSRFSGVSIFADSGPLWRALELRAQHPNSTSLVVRLLHNKYYSYAQSFLQNYLSHFSLRFLFITGDEIQRSKVPSIGQLYLLLAPFLLLGLLNLFTRQQKNKFVLLLWLFIAPAAAALTFQSPHALRAQNMAIPLAAIAGLGLFIFFRYITVYTPKIISFSLSAIIGLLLIFSFARYLHLYFVHYPYELPIAWEYGFEPLGDYLVKHQEQYDHIVVTNKYDQPYILVAFFTKFPPKQMQHTLVFSDRDQFGFSTGESFGKYQFKPVDYYADSAAYTLLILSDEGVPEGVKPIHTITFPNGEPAFRLYATN